MWLVVNCCSRTIPFVKHEAAGAAWMEVSSHARALLVKLEHCHAHIRQARPPHRTHTKAHAILMLRPSPHLVRSRMHRARMRNHTRCIRVRPRVGHRAQHEEGGGPEHGGQGGECAGGSQPQPQLLGELE